MTLPRSFKVASVIGTGGFTVFNNWQTIIGAGPNGSSKMTRICIFSPIRNLSSTINDEILFSRRTIGNLGWSFVWKNTNNYRFFINDGGSVQRNSDLIPTIVPKEGECIVLIGSYNETELICYAKSESTITGPWVGYTLSINWIIEIGYTTIAGGQAIDFIVIACLATDTYALSLAECATAEASIIDDLEQGRYIRTDQLPGTGWNWYWDARDCNIAIPGQWIDRVSGIIMNESGKTEQFGVSPRF